MIQFILYSRSYCHLCEDMLEQLLAALGNREHAIEIIDIDIEGNELLLEKYDELVPVLMASQDGQMSQQLCHYFLDLPALHLFFNESPRINQ